LSLSSQKAVATNAAAQVREKSTAKVLSETFLVLKKIASDTLNLAQAHDLVGAKKRVKALETAWDQGQEKLNAVNPGAWMAMIKP